MHTPQDYHHHVLHIPTDGFTRSCPSLKLLKVTPKLWFPNCQNPHMRKRERKKKGNNIFFDFPTNEEKPFSFHQYFFPMPRYYVLPLNRSRWGIFLTSLHSSPLSYLSSYLLIHWSTLDFWHYNCRMRHFCNPDIWLNERNFVSFALARYRLPTKAKTGFWSLMSNRYARNPIRPHT